MEEVIYKNKRTIIENFPSHSHENTEIIEEKESEEEFDSEETSVRFNFKSDEKPTLDNISKNEDGFFEMKEFSENGEFFSARLLTFKERENYELLHRIGDKNVYCLRNDINEESLLNNWVPGNVELSNKRSLNKWVSEDIKLPIKKIVYKEIPFVPKNDVKMEEHSHEFSEEELKAAKIKIPWDKKDHQFSKEKFDDTVLKDYTNATIMRDSKLGVKVYSPEGSDLFVEETNSGDSSMKLGTIPRFNEEKTKEINEMASLLGKVSEIERDLKDLGRNLEMKEMKNFLNAVQDLVSIAKSHILPDLEDRDRELNDFLQKYLIGSAMDDISRRTDLILAYINGDSEEYEQSFEEKINDPEEIAEMIDIN